MFAVVLRQPPERNCILDLLIPFYLTLYLPSPACTMKQDWIYNILVEPEIGILVNCGSRKQIAIGRQASRTLLNQIYGLVAFNGLMV